MKHVNAKMMNIVTLYPVVSMVKNEGILNLVKFNVSVN